MSRQRRNFSAKFKSDLVIELLKGEKDLNTLAVKNIQPNLLRNWKREKLHQMHLNEWTSHFADQKASGLTVRQWCKQNNYSVHSYNYWKHILKEELAGIYIVCGYTDLRYEIDSLAAIIERRYHMDLFVPNTLFLFCGRSSTKINGLLWEGDGFLLLYKRVECGHFSWPRNCNELRSMTPQQFKWLMQGFSIDPIIHDVIPRHSA